MNRLSHLPEWAYSLIGVGVIIAGMAVPAAMVIIVVHFARKYW